ncbi:putative phosphoglycerate mutase [Cellulosimicrobium cellulans]|uniref:Histidine phosphatase family protein n=1 Tax=Cellulosimicrobium cellulans TaxID=1710 RepID=A0A1Y0HSD7_CELCE|nr:histidine phosphatase family protein [Cellulosimicrobium cellulans]ARU51051.1 histidine phosphatase family protein [Cellulosimicrobium cellulans]MBM7821511.1 putative phosphoglycerate mutase [Cellulosimicrobium cellulans]
MTATDTTPDPQLVLVRHGETEWSASGRHTGRSDIPLTVAGEQQAVAAGVWLQRWADRRGRRPAVVLSSPRQRARRTADLAGFPDAETDDDLAEWDYGPVEGRTAVAVGEQLGHEWLIFRDGVNVLAAANGHRGEELADVAARAGRVLGRVEPVLQGGDDVVLFAHGHLLRVLATVWLGVDPALGARFELGTAAICLLGYGHGLRTVEGWNLSAQG